MDFSPNPLEALLLDFYSNPANDGKDSDVDLDHMDGQAALCRVYHYADMGMSKEKKAELRRRWIAKMPEHLHFIASSVDLCEKFRYGDDDYYVLGYASTGGVIASKIPPYENYRRSFEEADCLCWRCVTGAPHDQHEAH